MISRIILYRDLLRVEQWVKNSFLFAAIIFSKRFLDGGAIRQVVLAFFLFCGLASTVYIFNDLLDLKEDQNHPHKRFRPLASGRISKRQALVVLVVLLIASLSLSFVLDHSFAVLAGSYLALNVVYTLWLKRVVLLDVMAVAANYVIRVLAGAVVIHAPITPWLIIASTLLALFLALGKRRHELVLLGADAAHHRATLKNYSPYFLDQLIGIVTTSAVVIYSLYTMDPDVAIALGTTRLPLTIPFVLFGIFRYLYLIHQKEKGGNPTKLLLTDWPLLVDVVVWLLAIFALMYVL